MDVLDYKKDETNDLVIKDGDLVVVESTAQHQKDILLARKGHYRQRPDVGADIRSFLDDDSPGDLPGIVSAELEKDGMQISDVSLNADFKLRIDASY